MQRSVRGHKVRRSLGRGQDKPKKQNCFCEIVNKYRPRKQRFQGAPSPAEPWVFVCLRMICGTVRCLWAHTTSFARERRWVLLKIPRCDIDGVGETALFSWSRVKSSRTFASLEGNLCAALCRAHGQESCPRDTTDSAGPNSNCCKPFLPVACIACARPTTS